MRGAALGDVSFPKSLSPAAHGPVIWPRYPRCFRAPVSRHNSTLTTGDCLTHSDRGMSAMPSPANRLNRRVFVSMLPSAALGVVGCSTAPVQPRYVGPISRVVSFETRERPGTIVVDPTNHFLYLVQLDRRSLQYDVGVGKEGYGWSGVAAVHDKQEWPDWYPTKEILDRKPEITRALVQLQSGMGMRGGPANPLGARALYLWQGKVDTLYRIHGTNEPDSIGQNASSGCIRMRNEAVIDLYDRTPVGTKVVVLAAHSV